MSQSTQEEILCALQTIAAVLLWQVGLYMLSYAFIVLAVASGVASAYLAIKEVFFDKGADQ